MRGQLLVICQWKRVVSFKMFLVIGICCGIILTYILARHHKYMAAIVVWLLQKFSGTNRNQLQQEQRQEITEKDKSVKSDNLSKSNNKKRKHKENSDNSNTSGASSSSLTDKSQTSDKPSKEEQIATNVTKRSKKKSEGAVKSQAKLDKAVVESPKKGAIKSNKSNKSSLDQQKNVETVKHDDRGFPKQPKIDDLPVSSINIHFQNKSVKTNDNSNVKDPNTSTGTVSKQKNKSIQTEKDIKKSASATSSVQTKKSVVSEAENKNTCVKSSNNKDKRHGKIDTLVLPDNKKASEKEKRHHKIEPVIQDLVTGDKKDVGQRKSGKIIQNTATLDKKDAIDKDSDRHIVDQALQNIATTKYRRDDLSVQNVTEEIVYKQKKVDKSVLNTKTFNRAEKTNKPIAKVEAWKKDVGKVSSVEEHKIIVKSDKFETKTIIIEQNKPQGEEILKSDRLESKSDTKQDQIKTIVVTEIENQINTVKSMHVSDGKQLIKPTEIEQPEILPIKKTKELPTEIQKSTKEDQIKDIIESKIENQSHTADVSEKITNSKMNPKESVLKNVKKQQTVCSNDSSLKSPIESRENSQVRVLTLNDNEHLDSTLYRLEKNWVIQFRLGPSLLGRKVSLFFNYPEDNINFERKRYQLLRWNLDEGCEYSDDTALFTEVALKLSGSFHYYFTYGNVENNLNPCGSGFILVDPALKYGKNEVLPLDCIQCQTVLTKSLGPFTTWENKLLVAKETGYNMIHFTPIQELGASNSSYSLSDQLKLNPIFNSKDKKVTFDDVEKFLAKLRKGWKVTSICDIVLNHTANESQWLKEHPEATYNCQNCPYLRPAYLLDAALDYFANSVKNGTYEERGIPPEICNEDHINALCYFIKKDAIEPLRLHELYTCDVNKYVVEFLSLARNKVPAVAQTHIENEEIKLIQDPQYRRLSSTIDMNLALHIYNVYRSDCFDEETRIRKCAEDFKFKLDVLNQVVVDKLNEHLKAAIDNCLAGIRYFRVQHDGPRIKEITLQNPLVFRYFTDYGDAKSVAEIEEIMYSDKGRFLMAHNGWVMHDDPLRNFAASDSNVYLRRELIAWGDSVKLRYGDKPDDSPFLWNYMKTYVEKTAQIFDGVRLDNCHSTPLPVAEYLLDCARKVKPDLYIVAELFTNSDQKDNIFVNRLGIASLIREAMSAWDSHELGRLVHRYGGTPVGSFFQPNIRPLVPSIAHALFLDLTHDNPSPVEKRSVFDMLPNTALVNMACCASGSNRGYDELVPHHIHVVDETRQYTEWTETDVVIDNNPQFVSLKSGIISAKKALNELHYKLSSEGFNQVYVDQIDPDIVAVTRHNSKTHDTYVLVAFTAFSHPNYDAALHQKYIKPLVVEGVLDEIVFECTLSHVDEKKNGGSKYEHSKHAQDKTWINGFNEYVVNLKQHIPLEKSDVFEKVDSDSNKTQLHFKNFKPGSVVAIKVSQPIAVQTALKKVRELIAALSKRDGNELWKIIKKTDFSDLNRILYRCDQEERDDGNGFDVYNIPNFGSTVYAGFQGFISLLANIRPSNDLGHPLCNNLRQGDWMIDYIWKRLLVDDGTKELGKWLEENVKPLKDIPRYLIPCYFDVIVTSIYTLLLEQSYSLMTNFVKNGSSFVKGLSLGSLQFGGYVKSCDLPVLSPNLKAPKPPTRHGKDGKAVQSCVTLSAGLPHFSVGYMRNWGRDTFIALRGLFILTGRYQDARYHILGYAASLRHGLIPNLLDGGRNPRYNCRDAVWWWLYCIKCYVEEVPDGINILNDKVSRIFPTDEADAQLPGVVDQLLSEVMQQALQVHFQGLVFRERNAGRQIDAHMSDKGFNNQIGVHPDTGFIFGGNDANCGTWMDKMGSSDKAGNRGKPATPRDGSAIELIGLSKAVVTWLHKLHQQKQYAHDGVERINKNGTVIKWTFKQWSDKIKQSFEKHFWINTVPAKDEIRPDLINKRGIYKDCFGASQDWTDFQLRCNFPIAMVAAPELFDHEHAWTALQNAEKHLLGPLGMKTLDPDDWAYCGDYDNSNDSDNSRIANGFNYHQGPEWVWPVGYFLRARLLFAAQNGQLKQTLASTKFILSKHFIELQTSVWRGLPELTNSNGSYCFDSSKTQAWSMSCILETLYDLQKLEEKLLASSN